MTSPVSQNISRKLRSCIVFFMLLVSSQNLLSAPSVDGNTIHWPDDGWYQVQSADGLTSFCEGGRNCAVDPGSYIVINLTTGERFTDIVVGSSGNGASGPVVEGNTIRWPDDGWYQVQSADGLINFCEGGQSCTVVPGSYIVINLTTGERFTDVVVGGSGNGVAGGPWVEGNTIRWPDDGWYQVQSADGLIHYCEGGQSCTVDPGRYIVINLTTGVRFTDVVVGDSAGGGGGVPLVVGNTIRWPDDGWYEVRSADGLVRLCEGGSSCSVVDGTYLVINHSTGERFVDIDVPRKMPEASLCSNVEWQSGKIYCFDKATRALSAYLANNALDWSVLLPEPGIGGTFIVEGLKARDGFVDVLVSTLRNDRRMMDIVRYGAQGVFDKRLPILSEIADDRVFYPTSLTANWDIIKGLSLYPIYDIEFEYYLLGGMVCDQAADGERCMSFIAKVNPETGATRAYRELTAGMQVDTWQLQDGEIEFGDLRLRSDNFLTIEEAAGSIPEFPDTTLTAETLESTGRWIFNEIQGRAIFSLSDTVEIIPEVYKPTLKVSQSEPFHEAALDCLSGAGSVDVTYHDTYSGLVHLSSDGCQKEEYRLDGEYVQTYVGTNGKYINSARRERIYENFELSGTRENGAIAIEIDDVAVANYGKIERRFIGNYKEAQNSWEVSRLQETTPRSRLVITQSSYSGTKENAYSPYFEGIVSGYSSIYNTRTGEVNLELSAPVQVAFNIRFVTDFLQSLHADRAEGDDTMVFFAYEGEVVITAGDGSSVKVKRLSHGSDLYQLEEISTTGSVHRVIRVIPGAAYDGGFSAHNDCPREYVTGVCVG